MSQIAITISSLTFLIYVIPFLLARRTWHHSGGGDFLVLIFGLGITYGYDYLFGFDYLLLSAVLISMVIFWFRNPLQIVKGLFLISLVSLWTTLLTFTVFFDIWISGSIERSFILLGLTALQLCLEMIFRPIQIYFDAYPITASQICTFLLPSSIIFQLFLDTYKNFMVVTFYVVVTFICFVILAYGLYQSLILKKHGVRHQILYDTLLEDFSNLVDSEQSSREAILSSLTDDIHQIPASVRGEIQHLLSKQSMTSYSPNPYINLVAFGLTKTYPNLHISLPNNLFEKQIPLLCTWLELLPDLLLDHWEGTYLSIIMNPLFPNQVTLRIEGGKINSRQLSRLTHPSHFHYITFKQLRYWGSYLTLIYLTAELKLIGRLHLGEHTDMIFERGK